MTDFAAIRDSLESLTDSVERLDCPALECWCRDMKCDIRSIETELDQLEPDEADEFSELIPTNLSAGEADSLKELIRKWRTDNGYSNY